MSEDDIVYIVYHYTKQNLNKTVICSCFEEVKHLLHNWIIKIDPRDTKNINKLKNFTEESNTNEFGFHNGFWSFTAFDSCFEIYMKGIDSEII
ncbi:MAG: hypothetical protein ACPKQO_03520 [Nitrososphaeraceae archaeon]